MARAPALWFLVASLLFGLSHLFLLPPFEGSDETAHYSSIRQIADTGTLPLTGHSFIAEDVALYAAAAPMSYPRNFPRDTASVVWTYGSFFDSGDTDTYRRQFRDMPHDVSFSPSSLDNWQAQHPPLYYAAMAPLMRAAESFSLWAQFFSLRLVSYLMAMAGLYIAWRVRAPDEGSGALYGLFPILFPMFVPEFARIGNDSLCLFLLAIALGVFVRMTGPKGRMKDAWILGLVTAAGLVTKAFFLCFALGFTGIMLLDLWRARCDKAAFRVKADRMLLFVVPVFFALFWYLYRLTAFGSIVGDTDSIYFAQKGGSIIQVIGQGKNWLALIQGGLGIFVTAVWGGTGSLGQPVWLFAVPVLLGTLSLLALYLKSLADVPMTDRAWLPLWLGLPFIGGLIAHDFVTIGLSGEATVPGWYLHILAPLAAVALGRGARALAQKPWAHRIGWGLCFYAALMLMGIFWSQAAMYAGCAVPWFHKIYHFTEPTYCLSVLEDLYPRWQILGEPTLSVVAFVAGVAVLCTGFVLFRGRSGETLAARQN